MSLIEFEASWRRRTLSNGLRLIHCPLLNDNRFYLSALFGAGSVFDYEGKSGLAHFLEHMMFRGSQNYPSFLTLAGAFEKFGGEWNASTSNEATEYSYSGISSSLDKIIYLFGEFLKDPLLLDFEREKKIIHREIEDELNEFGNSTDMDLQKSQLFWPDSNYALPITGTKESLNSITIKNLRSFREKFYSADNAVITVVGGDGNNVLDALSENFDNYSLRGEGHLKEDLLNIDFVGPKIRWVNNSDNQLHILISFLTDGEWSSKSYAYSIIDLILSDGFSSRLTKRLREDLGIVYDVSSYVSLCKNTGTFDICASVTPDLLEKFVYETKTILNDLAINGPTEEEFAKAIRNYETSVNLYKAHIEDLGYDISWKILNNKDPKLNSTLGEVKKITSDKVKKVSEKLFRKENCGVVILGPSKEETRKDKILDLLC